MRHAISGATLTLAFDFKVDRAADVRVRIITLADPDPDPLEYGVDYTVALSTVSEGGVVTFTPALAVTGTAELERVTPRTQGKRLESVGRFPDAAVEFALDRLTMSDQELSEALARAPLLPRGLVGFDNRLPAPIDSGLLMTTAGSDGWTFYALADLEALADDAEAAAAAAAASEANAASSAGGAATSAATAGAHVTSAQTAEQSAQAALGGAWTWSSGTADADPGVGYLAANHATLSSATYLYVSETDLYAGAVAAVIQSWDDSASAVRGTLTLRKRGAPANFAIFNIIGGIVDGGAYDKLPVAYVAGGGAFAPGDVIGVAFVRTGDSGPGTGDMLKSQNLTGLADVSLARNNLGLGTTAVQNVATSGANVPLLNGANTHSGQTTFSTTVLFASALPLIRIDDTDGAADAKRARIFHNPNNLTFDFQNDAGDTTAAWLTVNHTGIVANSVTFGALVRAAGGSASAPTFARGDDTDTGLEMTGANVVYGVANGARIFAWSGNGAQVQLGQFFLQDGTVSLPGLAWLSDTDTGWRRTGANAVALTLGGVDVWTISAASIAFTQPSMTLNAKAVITEATNISADFINLAATRPSASTIRITADRVALYNSAGYAVQLTGVNETIDIAVAGAGGLDTGAEASNTTYHAHLIYNPTTLDVSAILSLSATAPILPSGYSFHRFLSVVRNDGGSDFIDYIQRDRDVWYKAVQNLLSGGGAGVETVISLSGLVPALAARFVIQATMTSSGLTTLKLRWVSGNDCFALITLNNWNNGQFTVPYNAGNFYYLFSGAAGSASVDLCGYTLMI